MSHIATKGAFLPGGDEEASRPLTAGQVMTARHTPALGSFRPPLRKRLVDITGAAILLVLFAPLAAFIALAIRLDSAGPVIYRQERVGLNRRRAARRRRRADVHTDPRRRADRRLLPAEGRPFLINKFRTMVANAEHQVGPTWAQKDDPRITRAGRALRATRLDELPQLWNVLRGDMSLVGPRPERPFFVARFAERIPHYRNRLHASPGITGLAQVEHRYDSCEEDVRRKLAFDLAYIQRYSLSADFRILAKTAFVMLTGRGAQ